MRETIAYNLIGLFFNLLFLLLPIIITVLIIRGIKAYLNNKTKIAKYNAETERIKAEAMREAARNGSTGSNDSRTP